MTLDKKVLFDAEAGIDVAVEERELGYLPQDYALFPHLDVLGNVTFGLAGLRGPERLHRAGEWIERTSALQLQEKAR